MSARFQKYGDHGQWTRTEFPTSVRCDQHRTTAESPLDLSRGGPRSTAASHSVPRPRHAFTQRSPRSFPQSNANALYAWAETTQFNQPADPRLTATIRLFLCSLGLDGASLDVKKSVRSSDDPRQFPRTSWVVARRFCQAKTRRTKCRSGKPASFCRLIRSAIWVQVPRLSWLLANDAKKKPPDLRRHAVESRPRRSMAVPADRDLGFFHDGQCFHLRDAQRH